MTSSALRPPGTVAVAPAAASAALRPLLCRRSRRGQVLGVSGEGAWIAIDEECIVIETAAGGRPPNGIALGSGGGDAVAARLVAGATVAIHPAHLIVGDVAVRLVRWWNPTPALPPVRARTLAARARRAGERIPGMADAGLEGALLGASAAGLHAAAAALLGSGEGLTPAGDDVLIGAVSSFGLLGRAVGNRPSGALLHSVAPTLVENARRRTTLISASLLGHACSGRVAAGIAALLSALGGWGDLDRAVDGVLSLGHSSGPALAFGVVAGARAVCGGP